MGMKGGIHRGNEKGHTPGGMKGGIHWDGMEGDIDGGESQNNSSIFRNFFFN